jgi:hypothetical protein
MWGFYKDLKYFWTFLEKLRLFQGLRDYLNGSFDHETLGSIKFYAREDVVFKK